MEKINLTEGMMLEVMKEEAWKDISRHFGFTLQMLEKYQNQLDWDEISGNVQIVWTVEMLDKFKKRINWTELSELCDESLLTLEIVERFKDYFDWKALSRNSSLPISIVEEYPNLIDWKEIIRYCYSENSTILTHEFFEKYIEYIPASASKLWNCIVSEIYYDIERKIRNGE